jgi:hypothetical protein
MATYHGARRQWALSLCGAHLLLLVLSVVALGRPLHVLVALRRRLPPLLEFLVGANEGSGEGLDLGREVGGFGKDRLRLLNELVIDLEHFGGILAGAMGGEDFPTLFLPSFGHPFPRGLLEGR